MRERAVPILPGDDLGAAKDFYVGRLGFQVEFESSEDGKSGLLGITRGTIELTIDCPMSGHGRNACASLRVDSADGCYEEWSRRIEIERPPVDEPWGARTFGFRDPFGNTLFVIGPIDVEERQSPKPPATCGADAGRDVAGVNVEPSSSVGGHMKQTANARFVIENWDEQAYSEGQDLPKLTRASVTKTWSGDISGEGRVEYLMMYRRDGSASFVGLERVVGRLGGKAGSFVLQRTGVFEGGLAKESYVVVPGSGTGELQGLSGEGTSAVGHGNEHPFTLGYEQG